MVLKLICVFVFSFVLNLIWEHFHSRLYIEYRGKPITRAVLRHAALFDASFTTLLSLPFFLSAFFETHLWILILIAFIFAVGLERFALATNRWRYKPAMPIIPFLAVGVTPSIQLGLIAWIVLSFVRLLP